MVTKGIITSIPIDSESNKYEVRLPFFESAIEDAEEVIYEATLSESPGINQGYNIGDIVYCTFEDNNLGRPVIIGKLFTTDTDNTSAEIETLDLDVTKRASLPANTTIGNATTKDIANISEIKNKVSKMGDTIYGSMTFGNTINLTTNKLTNLVDENGNTLISDIADNMFSDTMTRQCSTGTQSVSTGMYIKLCNIKFTAHYQGRFIEFRIYVGKGNNGNPDQNAYIDLLLQSGWENSLNGRMGGYWELHPMGTSLIGSNFGIVVTSDNRWNYSVWLYINGVTYCKPSYTVFYDREISNTNICSIEHIGNISQTTLPIGEDESCLIDGGEVHSGTDITYGSTVSAVATTSSVGTSDAVARSDHTHNITSSTITSALGYTPYNSSNPNGYTNNVGTITGISVNGTSIATSGVANLETNTTYDATSNKIATVSDIGVRVVQVWSGASTSGTWSNANDYAFYIFRGTIKTDVGSVFTSIFPTMSFGTTDSTAQNQRLQLGADGEYATYKLWIDTNNVGHFSRQSQSDSNAKMTTVWGVK